MKRFLSLGLISVLALVLVALLLKNLHMVELSSEPVELTF